MKRSLLLTTAITLLASYAIAPAKDHEDHEDHEHGEHHGEGGQKGKAANLPPASTQQGVTYEKDIAPLLEVSCVKCHGEDKQKGKIRLDTLDGIMKGGEDGAIVVPGQSVKSSIVLSVARVDRETAMPPDRKPGKDVGADGKKLPPVVHFTPEQVGLIRAWIDQGAK
jgi:hypothetical protein